MRGYTEQQFVPHGWGQRCWRNYRNCGSLQREARLVDLRLRGDREEGFRLCYCRLTGALFSYPTNFLPSYGSALTFLAGSVQCDTLVTVYLVMKQSLG
uniref:Uncharacterized protein n=1 Tax=Arundo donax TaxID=35708 RepID=A0A0A9DEY3_ARUDO